MTSTTAETTPGTALAPVDVNKALAGAGRAEAAQALVDANQALADAQLYQVDSPEMFELATSELRTIATKMSELEEKRLGITRPMDAAKRAVMDLFRAPLERLEQADGLLRKACTAWTQAENEKRRRAQEEAERLAKAEADRLEAERKAAEEAERQARDAADAALAAGDQEAFQAAVEAADQAALEREEVEAVQELNEVAPVMALDIPNAPKAAGISTRESWKHEVTSLGELVTAAAAALAAGDETLLGYLVADDKALAGVGRALKAKAKVPGVRFYAEAGLAVRKR